MNFDNLFYGNKELSDNVNLFFRSHWSSFFEDIRIPFIESLSNTLKETGNLIFSRKN